MSDSYTLLMHYLCPFARRAMYAGKFKGLEMEWMEVDLSDKPAILLDTHPAGSVPALIIKRESEVVRKMGESLDVMEVFDSAGPAPYLFPRD
jgi:glutathione S-transferase